MKTPDYKAVQESTQKFAEVNLDNAACIFYVGGHGPMWDLANDKETAKKTAAFYESSGLVAAVCHGPAALVPLVLSDGKPLIEGHKVTSFTNKEEDAVQLTDAMPFPLETKLKDLGGEFTCADDMWK